MDIKPNLLLPKNQLSTCFSEGRCSRPIRNLKSFDRATTSFAWKLLADLNQQKSCVKQATANRLDMRDSISLVEWKSTITRVILSPEQYLLAITASAIAPFTSLFDRVYASREQAC